MYIVSRVYVYFVRVQFFKNRKRRRAGGTVQQQRTVYGGTMDARAIVPESSAKINHEFRYRTPWLLCLSKSKAESDR